MHACSNCLHPVLKRVKSLALPRRRDCERRACVGSGYVRTKPRSTHTSTHMHLNHFYAATMAKALCNCLLFPRFVSHLVSPITHGCKTGTPTKQVLRIRLRSRSGVLQLAYAPARGPKGANMSCKQREALQRSKMRSPLLQIQTRIF